MRAMLAMARAKRPLSTVQISRMEDISLPYLEQIFSRLRRAGLVQARRGAQGGYALSRPPAEISVGDIVSVLDGPITFSRCHRPGQEEDCVRKEICASRKFWADLENDINSKLFSTSLDDLRQVESGLLEKKRGNAGATNIL